MNCNNITMIVLRGQGPSKVSTIKLMIYSMLIIFLLSFANCKLPSTVASYPSIGKCCPVGQLFSVTENFTCAYCEDRKRELYPLKGHVNYNDFITCADSEKLTITSLDDIANNVIRASVACVDLLWDEKVGQTIPIIFQCDGNEEKNDGNLTTTEIIPTPRLTSLRMCCDLSSVYDVKKRDCVPRNEKYDVEDYFKFLDDKVDFVTIVRGAPKCKHAILDHVINITTDLRVFDTGKLQIDLSSEVSYFWDNDDENCLHPSNLAPDLMIVRYCHGSKFCRKNACIRKCCPEDEAIIGDGCEKIPAQVPPGRFHEALLNASVARGIAASEKFLEMPDYGLMIGKPCKYGMFPVQPSEDWYITQRGHFNLSTYRVYEHHEYCIDMFYMDPNVPESLYPFVCFDGPDEIEESPIRFGINAALELTSCAFLAITLLVYICLPALQNLHGKTLMCHVASLIVAYASLAAVALATPTNSEVEQNKSTILCKFLGYTMLLSWISAFSWLNVMCFDIWWTFGGLGGAAVSGGRGRAFKKRFVMYSLYAWGFALFVTCMGVAVDHTEFLADYLRPNIGTDSCWFERNTRFSGEIIFFIGPVTLQLIANVIFFVLTAMYCSKVKAEITRVMAAPADPRSRRFRSDRTKLIMNVKLFIVMGVSWVLEVASSILNHYATNLSWRNEFFYIADTFNCLQGLLIFILFVLKSKVYNALRRRFGRGKEKIPTNHGGLQDPYRVRNSASSSTIMSTFAVSTAP